MKILLKKDENYIVVDSKKIVLIEARFKELEITTDYNKLYIKKPLVSFLNQEGMGYLTQISKSTVVNILKIEKVRFSDTPIINLNCGNDKINLKVSRHYKKQFITALKSNVAVI